MRKIVFGILVLVSLSTIGISIATDVIYEDEYIKFNYSENFTDTWFDSGSDYMLYMGSNDRINIQLDLSTYHIFIDCSKDFSNLSEFGNLINSIEIKY